MKTKIAIFILAAISVTAFGQWEEELKPKNSDKEQYEQLLEKEKGNKKKSKSSSSYDLPELSEDASQALITNFDAALQRRLYAMKSTGYHGESYWKLMESYYYFLRNSYDKNLYNVVAINDQVWVEPQYITAMFDGSDPAQGVNDFIAVLYKKKQLESKEESERYYRNDFYLNVGMSWGMWNPWYYPWGPYYPYGPWGPYYPFGPYYPYGPWGPYWGGPVVVVVPSHPVYYGNGTRSSIYSPSPSVRTGGRAGGNVITSGDPFGRNSSYRDTKYRTTREDYVDRSYRNNTNTTYRNNTMSTSGHGGFGGGTGAGFGGGGGGFHSIGGGGFRR